MAVKFPFYLGLALMLTACQTAPHKAAQEPQIQAANQRQNFMEIGRGLSHGAVDLYQPGTDFLDAAPQAQMVRGSRISPIPNNPNILVASPNVTIYSLDTMEVREPKPALLPPGVPDVEAAAPTDLTNKEQAPEPSADSSNLMTTPQDDDSSPFDKNGNLK